MLIQVDWYKVHSGKWYEGGTIEIGDAKLWKGDLIQAIVNKQSFLVDTWTKHGNYIVVTRDTDENMKSLDYHEFYHAMYFPNAYMKLEKHDDRFDVRP